MLTILFFLLGTGTGVALKYLWDKYKDFETTQSQELITQITTPIIIEENIELPDNETDRFYIQSISSLFGSYDVNINELNAFGTLCNKIQRKIRVDLLELLVNQTSAQSLLHTYQTESIRPFQVSFSFANSGAYISGSYLTDTIKNLGLFASSNESLEGKVELILKAYYAKGIEAILNNFGKEFEKLELLNDVNDSTLEKYYNTLKEDINFHLKLLNK